MKTLPRVMTGLLLAGVLGTGGALVAEVSGAQRTSQSSGASLAPYVPTPQDVVERMLDLANVTNRDVVYDLGSGDGRLVIAAARRGARGVGIDIDPERVTEAQANAKAAGVEHLTTFVLGDALQADVSEASVVTLYLLSSSNLRLRPMLTRQLRPGARVVSHAFGMGDWKAEKVDTFKDANGSTRTLYLWKTDGRPRP
jgi:SAM-dependent methyltransferase